MDLEADLQLLCEAVREAGALAQRLKADGLQVHFKPDHSQVTNADLAVDALLKDQLRSARPTYGWRSEESPDDGSSLSAEASFVLDPIDGTHGFIKGKPWWTLAVAVVRAGRPVAGVVYAPELDALYAARAGGPALLNGEDIFATRRSHLEQALAHGDPRLFDQDFWADPWPDMDVQARPSVAYRMVAVAAGDIDFTLALTPKQSWDVAAADLICQQAGAVVSDVHGQPYDYSELGQRLDGLICAGPGLYPLILNRCQTIRA
ncbi:MAG: inositol monophosphatase family protein [Asticcacaulis sp.]